MDGIRVKREADVGSAASALPLLLFPPICSSPPSSVKPEFRLPPYQRAAGEPIDILDLLEDDCARTPSPPSPAPAIAVPPGSQAPSDGGCAIDDDEEECVLVHDAEEAEWDEVRMMELPEARLLELRRHWADEAAARVRRVQVKQEERASAQLTTWDDYGARAADGNSDDDSVYDFDHPLSGEESEEPLDETISLEGSQDSQDSAFDQDALDQSENDGSSDEAAEDAASPPPPLRWEPSERDERQWEESVLPYAAATHHPVLSDAEGDIEDEEGVPSTLVAPGSALSDGEQSEHGERRETRARVEAERTERALRRCQMKEERWMGWRLDEARLDGQSDALLRSIDAFADHTFPASPSRETTATEDRRATPPPQRSGGRCSARAGRPRVASPARRGSSHSASPPHGAWRTSATNEDAHFGHRRLPQRSRTPSDRSTSPSSLRDRSPSSESDSGCDRRGGRGYGRPERQSTSRPVLSRPSSQRPRSSAARWNHRSTAVIESTRTSPQQRSDRGRVVLSDVVKRKTRGVRQQRGRARSHRDDSDDSDEPDDRLQGQCARGRALLLLLDLNASADEADPPPTALTTTITPTPVSSHITPTRGITHPPRRPPLAEEERSLDDILDSTRLISNPARHQMQSDLRHASEEDRQHQHRGLRGLRPSRAP